jgi:hypothetical protein
MSSRKKRKIDSNDIKESTKKRKIDSNDIKESDPEEVKDKKPTDSKKTKKNSNVGKGVTILPIEPPTDATDQGTIWVNHKLDDDKRKPVVRVNSNNVANIFDLSEPQGFLFAGPSKSGKTYMAIRFLVHAINDGWLCFGRIFYTVGRANYKMFPKKWLIEMDANDPEKTSDAISTHFAKLRELKNDEKEIRPNFLYLDDAIGQLDTKNNKVLQSILSTYRHTNTTVILATQWPLTAASNPMVRSNMSTIVSFWRNSAVYIDCIRKLVDMDGMNYAQFADFFKRSTTPRHTCLITFTEQRPDEVEAAVPNHCAFLTMEEDDIELEGPPGELVKEERQTNILFKQKMQKSWLKEAGIEMKDANSTNVTEQEAVELLPNVILPEKGLHSKNLRAMVMSNDDEFIPAPLAGPAAAAAAPDDDAKPIEHDDATFRANGSRSDDLLTDEQKKRQEERINEIYRKLQEEQERIWKQSTGKDPPENFIQPAFIVDAHGDPHPHMPIMYDRKHGGHDILVPHSSSSGMEHLPPSPPRSSMATSLSERKRREVPPGAGRLLLDLSHPPHMDSKLPPGYYGLPPEPSVSDPFRQYMHITDQARDRSGLASVMRRGDNQDPSRYDPDAVINTSPLTALLRAQEARRKTRKAQVSPP